MTYDDEIATPCNSLNLEKVTYATFTDVALARSISYLGPSPTYFYIQYTCYTVKKEYERGKEGAE